MQINRPSLFYTFHSHRKFIALLLLIFSGCSSQVSRYQDPEKMPYAFSADYSIECDFLLPVDLDGNGFTELIAVDTSLTAALSGSKIVLYTFERKIIAQINYSGKIIDGISTIDYNEDDVLEIIVPYVRNDSLFVCLTSHTGEKLFHIFLIDGKPRVHDGGRIRWDPGVMGFFMQDINNDGMKELITVMTTGYARLPRGVLVHSLPSGKLIGKSIIGPSPRDNFLDDFDGDGQPEILCLGMSPGNGANAGGFDDSHSYLFLFELNPVKIANFFEISKIFSSYRLFYTDIDGDGKKELIASTETYSEKIPMSKIMVIDPLTFQETKKRTLCSPFSDLIFTNLNYDLKLEIIAAQSTNKLIVLDSDFETMKQREFPSTINNLKSLPDIDDDGVEEFIVRCSEGDYVLNPNLKIKAFLPGIRIEGIVRRGENQSAHLVVRSGQNYILGPLMKNPNYFFKRYFSVIFALFISLLFIILLYWIQRLAKRNHILHQLQVHAIDSDTRGFLLFQKDDKIHFINQTLCSLLSLKTIRTLPQVFSEYPEVLTFVHDAINDLQQPEKKSIELLIGIPKRKMIVKIQSIPTKNQNKPLWLLTFIDKAGDDEVLQAKTWCKMAQKTAHDIKNPLSAIMLKLQRLQTLYRERFPEAANEFDPYVARIIERIESLRRISKNFMKFVNIENLNLANTDINAFLNDAVQIIQPGLPPDIRLNIHTTEDLPMLKIDQDAMRSVIENLVSNAVNAMPEGGQITISTQYLRDMTIPDNGKDARNYIEIEVLDTGTGISAADRERLFEPDFTTSDYGNGLGLAFVKKTVDDHGGIIEVASEPNIGTTFSIYIPIGQILE